MVDEVFLAHLNKYPAIQKRMEELLNVAGVLTESLNLTDDAEGTLKENSRQLNRKALQAWASNKVNHATTQYKKESMRGQYICLGY